MRGRQEEGGGGYFACAESFCCARSITRAPLRLTPEEVARLNAEAGNFAQDRPDDANRDVSLAHNLFWWDRGVVLDSTSLIADPKDGRLPPYTAEGSKRRAGDSFTAAGDLKSDSWTAARDRRTRRAAPAV